MNPAALRNEDNASAPVLYMALELSNKNWKLAFGDGTMQLCPAIIRSLTGERSILTKIQM